jgi:hypothetical protein
MDSTVCLQDAGIIILPLPAIMQKDVLGKQIPGMEDGVR